MKLDIVANSGNDEFYTPAYAIMPIIPYLKTRNYKKYGALLILIKAIL